MAGISQYRIVPQRTSVQEPLNKQGSHNEILTTLFLQLLLLAKENDPNTV